MGIPGLKRHLQPFATRVDLGNRHVIIDGPALAHHIVRVCWSKTSRGRPFELPLYSQIGESAVAWLDELRSCGVTM